MTVCGKCGRKLIRGEEVAIDDEGVWMCEDCCNHYIDIHYSAMEIMEALGYEIMMVTDTKSVPETDSDNDDPLDGQLDIFGVEHRRSK